jgi:hypothetical protein
MHSMRSLSPSGMLSLNCVDFCFIWVLISIGFLLFYHLIYVEFNVANVCGELLSSVVDG